MVAFPLHFVVMDSVSILCDTCMIKKQTGNTTVSLSPAYHAHDIHEWEEDVTSTHSGCALAKTVMTKTK